MSELDPAQLRISDAERHQVAEILREAAGAGRLDLDELDERLEATYRARTYADLVPITLDLPATGPAAGIAARPAQPSPVVDGGPASERLVAIMGGLQRRGHWVVPQQLTLFCMMGGADLDLREARFAAREVVLTVNCLMGGADIRVNPHTRVIMEGVGIMGGYSGPSEDTPAELDASSPVVRVKGIAIWGGVSVERTPVPGAGKRLGRRR